MPVSRSGITYAFAPGYSEDWQLTSQTVQLHITCAWSDRMILYRDILGWSQLAGNQLQRILPMTHPETPAVAVGANAAARGPLWATGVRLVEPKGFILDQGDGIPRYRFAAGHSGNKDGKAVYAVTFQSTLYDVKADGAINGEWQRYVIRRWRATTEAQRIPSNTWRWAGTTTTIREATSLPYQLKEIQWLWLALPGLPPNLDLGVSHVNEIDFEEYAAGTLLIGPAQVEPRQLPNLVRGYDVTISAVHRPSGWNRFWKPTDPTGANRGAGFYDVEANTADVGGNRRKPYLSYPMQKMFSFIPDAGAAGGL